MDIGIPPASANPVSRPSANISFGVNSPSSTTLSRTSAKGPEAEIQLGHLQLSRDCFNGESVVLSARPKTLCRRHQCNPPPRRSDAGRFSCVPRRPPRTRLQNIRTNPPEAMCRQWSTCGHREFSLRPTWSARHLHCSLPRPAAIISDRYLRVSPHGFELALLRLPVRHRQIW
jgi:hypothetical protein